MDKARPAPADAGDADSNLWGRAALRVEPVFAGLARLSFALAVFFTPFRFRWTLFERPLPPVYADYTDGLIFLSDVCLALLLICWLAGLALRPRRVTLGPSGLALALAGLLLTGGLSVAFSVSPLLSAYHLARLALLAGLYLYVVNEVAGLRALIPPLAAGVFVQAAVAVTQWLAQADVGLQRFGEYELDPAWNGVSIVWAQAGRSLRAYGLADHPNILGGVLAFALILLLAWLAASEDEPRRGPGQAVIQGVFLLGLAALLLTFSRSAWLAFAAAVALAAALALYAGRRRMLLDAAGLLLAGALILTPLVWRSLPYLGVRFNLNGSFEQVPYEKGSLGERAVLNQVANQLFVQNGLTGVGLGAFPVALRQAQPDYPFTYQPPHLVILEAAAETGVFGALFYALGMTLPWLALLLRRRRLAFSPDLIAASALLLAVGVVGVFDYYPWLLAPGRFWQWLAWGLWAAMYARAGIRHQPGDE